MDGVGVGIDDGTCAVLAGVQALGLLEPDDDLTIRLPALFLKVTRQVLGECARCELPIGVEPLIVAGAEGDHVVVGSQVALFGESPQAVGCLPSQQGLNFGERPIRRTPARRRRPRPPPACVRYVEPDLSG